MTENYTTIRTLSRG